MSIQEETKEAEGKFLRFIEEHEQKVLELVSLTSKQDSQVIPCQKCGKEVAAPIYLHNITCLECSPGVTLEAEQLESLLKTEREGLFQRLSDLDETFSENEYVKLRDSVIQELRQIQILIEASVDASESLKDLEEDDEGVIDEKEFDSLLRNLTRVRALERLAKVFDINPEVTSEILKTRIEVLFGAKVPKTYGVLQK